MEVERTCTIKLTEKECELLQNAANLIGNIDAEIDIDYFGYDYDLSSVKHNILEFLDDPNVYVEWEEK